KGIALITVLFMFALLAIVISSLIVVSSSDINRAKNYILYEQAYLLCLSGEEIARQILIEDFQKNPDIDHINKDWAESGRVIRIDGGYIEIFIEDATGKFNINNFSDANPGKQKLIFSNMLNIFLDEKSLADTLSEQMKDWIDTDHLNGTEEFDYLSEDPSYRTPNGLIADISEMRWLKDMDADTYKLIYDELFSDLTAIPAQNKININTITPLTLAGLANMSVQSAEDIVEKIRGEKNGFSSAAQAVVGLPGIDISLLDVKSNYFQVRVRAKYGEHYAYMTSLILRDRNLNGRMEVISRSRSKKFIFPFSEDYNEAIKPNDYD